MTAPDVDPVVESMAQREGVSTAAVMRRLDEIAAGQARQVQLTRPSKETRTPKAGDEYAALRMFGYCGVELERGQLFVMRGARNDEALHRLGYCVPFDRGIDDNPFLCAQCGVWFVSIAARTAHGEKRHAERPVRGAPVAPVRDEQESSDMFQNRVDDWAQQTGAAADADLERETARDDALAPLRMDQTAATRS